MFIEQLNTHRGKHELSFYAERMNISPQYLSRLVFETSGTAASDWINRAVTLQAKLLLRSSDLTIEQIAEELLALNRRMQEEKRSYILVGPGRWGSSDPFLGVPVKWTHISEAKVIVECNLPNFNVEPSQGTHFFQNITSLGVGYLTVDTVYGDGMVNDEAISALECVHDGEFVKLYKAPETLVGYIDRSSGKAIVGY